MNDDLERCTKKRSRPNLRRHLAFVWRAVRITGLRDEISNRDLPNKK
jgi:hypothetical protein